MTRTATTYTALSVLLLALVTAPRPSTAGVPPLVGTYKTLLGTILPGRASESWPCDGCEGQLGNTINSASWNGSTLATNWSLSCPQIASSPVLVLDTVVGGTGQRIYQTSYSGGSLWLAGSGAWGAGDPAYTGSIQSFVVMVTKQYVGGTLVGAVSNINFTGTIDNYDNCFTMAISNAEFVGATPGTALEPGPFPAFLGPASCNATGTHGSWFDVHDVTFSILGRCETPTRTRTWGELKSLYR